MSWRTRTKGAKVWEAGFGKVGTDRSQNMGRREPNIWERLAIIWDPAYLTHPENPGPKNQEIGKKTAKAQDQKILECAH